MSYTPPAYVHHRLGLALTVGVWLGLVTGIDSTDPNEDAQIKWLMWLPNWVTMWLPCGTASLTSLAPLCDTVRTLISDAQSDYDLTPTPLPPTPV